MHEQEAARWLRQGRKMWGSFAQVAQRLEVAGERELAQWLQEAPVRRLQLGAQRAGPAAEAQALQALQAAAQAPAADPALQAAVAALQAALGTCKAKSEP